MEKINLSYKYVVILPNKNIWKLTNWSENEEDYLKILNEFILMEEFTMRPLKEFDGLTVGEVLDITGQRGFTFSCLTIREDDKITTFHKYYYISTYTITPFDANMVAQKPLAEVIESHMETLHHDYNQMQTQGFSKTFSRNN